MPTLAIQNHADIVALEGVLWSTAVLVGCAAVATVAVVVVARARVGRELAVERTHRPRRTLALACVAALAAFVVIERDTLPAAPALVVLALGAAVFAVRPSSGEAVFGERGVRAGWHARSFEQLEEWRLAGDHLRWKLGPDWLACRVPLEMQSGLRKKLETLCPERESRFAD